MEKSTFGNLVSVLRQDMLHETGRQWTQKHLADACGLTLNQIKDIENNRRKWIHPDEISQLADAFKLTYQARQKFFNIGTGAIEHLVPTANKTSKETLEHLVSHVRDVYLPWGIVDSFCNLLVVNHGLVRLLLRESIDINTLAKMNMDMFAEGINLLHIFYAEEFSAFQNAMGSQLPKYRHSALQVFRYQTLPFRGSIYVHNVLRQLKKIKEFSIDWFAVSQFKEDWFWDNDPGSMQHKEYGRLRFISSTMTASTPYGEIVLYKVVPKDNNTASGFMKMMDNGGKNLFFVSKWPQNIQL